MWMQYASSAAVLLVALIAFVRATAAQRAAEDAERSASRRADGVREELTLQIETLKRQLAMVAAGETLNEEMIEDGQLWRDVDGHGASGLVGGDGGSVFIVDVRTPAEMASGVIVGAALIPMDEIEARKAEIPNDGRPVLVYCAAGGRSAAVCEFLTKEGFKNLHNLLGGFGAWPGETHTPDEAAGPS